jgi:hypothetical protein
VNWLELRGCPLIRDFTPLINVPNLFYDSYVRRDGIETIRKIEMDEE